MRFFLPAIMLSFLCLTSLTQASHTNMDDPTYAKLRSGAPLQRSSMDAQEQILADNTVAPQGNLQLAFQEAQGQQNARLLLRISPLWRDSQGHQWYIIDEQIPLIPSALRRTAPINQPSRVPEQAATITLKYVGPVKNNAFDAAPYLGHQYMACFKGSAPHKNAYELFTFYPVTR
jgi:hypothetical protein